MNTWNCLGRTVQTAAVLGLLATSGCNDNSNGAQPELPDGTGKEVDLSRPETTGDITIADWCTMPAVNFGEPVALDKATFVNTIADYTVGWMAPLHEVLLGVDEVSMLQASIDMVQATYDTQCRSENDYEFLPPDQELIDPEAQVEVRDQVIAFFEDAVEIESGPRLVLEVGPQQTCVGDCVASDQTPTRYVVEMDAAGAMTIDVEFANGRTWTRSIYVTPHIVASQGDLAEAVDWLRESNPDTEFPDVTGTTTVIARKDQAGHMAMSFGLAQFSLVANPATSDEASFVSSENCMGFGVHLGPPATGSELAVHAGVFDASLPGSSHCSGGCGEKEESGRWDYHVGDVSFTVAQPPADEAHALEVAVGSGEPSTASVAGDEFARGGLGPQGSGGSFTSKVQNNPDHFVVSFEPALDLGGAMTISSFSDAMRMDMPTWLSDEVFDLSFGGDPVGSIVVPVRELCSDGTPGTVQRRQVRVETGGGSLTVGGGRTLEASAGQCIGKSLGNPSTFTRTSDWWEAGFACE